jgi:hypothetical protein
MTSIATSVRSALEKQENLPNLPTTVSSWHVEAGPDATDEPAVWVWVTLEEDVDAKTRAIEPPQSTPFWWDRSHSVTCATDRSTTVM